MKLEIEKPGWLIAFGDTRRLEVLRSPLVRDDASMYEPVRRFIADCGLVLAAQKTFEDHDWMHGKVGMSVFVPPEVRNGVLAGTEMSLPWYAASALMGTE